MKIKQQDIGDSNSNCNKQAIAKIKLTLEL